MKARAVSRAASTVPWAIAIAVLAAFAWSVVVYVRAPATAATPGVAAPRVVSLAPAITETLRAIDAASSVVALSDFCANPDGLPRVGSAITPHFEAIARVRPTLILATEVAGSQMEPLGRLAKTVQLPWLTVEDVSGSVRRLGQLTHANAEANALAHRFETELSAIPPLDAPRVLLLLGDAGAGTASYWFIRDDSLHGALLRAAGGKNAVTSPVHGAPRLSAEEIIRIDPDVVVLISTNGRESVSESALAEIRKLTPLHAVQSGAVGTFTGADLLGAGPSLLSFIAPLRRKLQELASRAP